MCTTIPTRSESLLKSNTRPDLALRRVARFLSVFHFPGESITSLVLSIVSERIGDDLFINAPLPLTLHFPLNLFPTEYIIV